MFAPAGALALAFVLGGAGAQAKPCRDATGHFVACPAPAAAAPAAQRCRNAAGHFVKCPAPGATAATPNLAPARPTPPQARATRVSPPAAPARPAGAAGMNTSTVAPAAPGTVTARCRDGTVSHSQHRSGTCSRHGGVAAWM
jgi:hypothetical protein